MNISENMNTTILFIPTNGIIIVISIPALTLIIILYYLRTPLRIRLHRTRYYDYFNASTQ